MSETAHRCIVVTIVVGMLCALPLITPHSHSENLIEGPPDEGQGFVINCGFYAEEGEGKENCDFTHLFELARRVMNLLIWLATTGVAIAIVYYGSKMAMNAFIYHGDAQAAQNDAKNGLKMALFGLVIVLGSWLFVNFIFDTLGYRFGGPFDPPPQGLIDPLPPTSGPDNCPNCRPLSNRVTCKSTANCSVDGGTASKLETLSTQASVPSWRVTEGFPPTVTHQNQCHYKGTCVDANFTGTNKTRPSGNAVNRFIEAAKRQGLGPVYETSASEITRLAQEGVPEKYLKNYGTAPHFSVYNCDYNPEKCY